MHISEVLPQYREYNVGMEDELQQMQQRFGKQGMSELQKLDGMNMSILWRLYLVSSVAANISKFDPQLSREFYNKQTANINLMVDDLDKFTAAFQKKRGEI